MTLKEFAQTTFGKRFFNKVDQQDCWLWTAGLRNGYGWLRCPFVGKNRGAHQVIMRALHGPTPEGKEICHTCNVRRCVNPKHLYFGTRRQNMLDAVKAKTHNFVNHDRVGVKSPHAKFTETQIRRIRNLRFRGFMIKDIARIMNANVNTINGITCGARYRSVK